MKQLSINWQAFRTAFEDEPDEFGTDRAYYFDLENGEVVFVDEEVRSTAAVCPVRPRNRRCQANRVDRVAHFWQGISQGH